MSTVKIQEAQLPQRNSASAAHMEGGTRPSIPIPFRFPHMVTYWLKIAYFCYIFLPLSHSAPSLPMFPLEFRAEVNHEETRVMGLSSSEDSLIPAGSRFGIIPACDGRSDTRPDRIYHS